MAGVALRVVALLAAVASSHLADSARAQGVSDPRPPAGPRGEQQQPQSAPAPPATAPKSNPSISLTQALYLIRSTLLTLNDANRSGNYSVLRDLAAPGFQQKNSAADLALIFSDLRRRNFDLFAVALAAPQLAAAPARDHQGMLRLTGLFPTRPQQINFDLLFQDVAGQWRLFGISVQTPEAPPLPQVKQQGATSVASKRAPAGKGQ
jgi:hypothetical protein